MNPKPLFYQSRLCGYGGFLRHYPLGLSHINEFLHEHDEVGSMMTSSRSNTCAYLTIIAVPPRSSMNTYGDKTSIFVLCFLVPDPIHSCKHGRPLLSFFFVHAGMQLHSRFPGMFPDALTCDPYGVIQNAAVVAIAISIYEFFLNGILLHNL